MRTESNMTKARRIVEENEVKLGACMLKPERERFIESAAKFIDWLTPERFLVLTYDLLPSDVKEDLRRCAEDVGYFEGLSVERKAVISDALLRLHKIKRQVDRHQIDYIYGPFVKALNRKLDREKNEASTTAARDGGEA